MDPVCLSRGSDALPNIYNTHIKIYIHTQIITSTPHTYTKATLSEEVQSWLKPFLLKVGLEDAEFPDLEDATTDNNMHNTHYQMTNK